MRLNISLRRWTPRTVCTARLGRPLSTQYMGAKRSSSIRGSASFRKTSAQLLSRRLGFQELGLPEALLRVSYSEHPPLPRPGAAPTTFYYIIPTLPQAGRGFYEQIKVGVLLCPKRRIHCTFEPYSKRNKLSCSSGLGCIGAKSPSPAPPRATPHRCPD